MFGAYTALELEAERRRELVEQSLREAAERHALDEAQREGHGSDDPSRGHGIADIAASFFNRVGQRV